MSVLGLVSAAALSGGAVLSARWYGRRVDPLGRPRDFPVWSVSLLAVLAVAAAVPGVRRHSEEQRLSHVASVLVGHRVTVHCQSFGQALTDVGAELGFVKWDERGRPEPQTLIKRDPCAELRHYYGGDEHHPSRDEIIAVHVLTHEAMHMRGELNESTAECQALQRDEQTAGLLGATPAQARMLARLYWGTVYPDMPDDYRTGDCGPGGRLDEELDTAPWT
jgi:hypothetical protein